MTRAQQRAFLRSKLGDRSATTPIFTDSALNLVLLMAGRVVQNWVNKTDPNPYTKVLYGDITANVDLYSLPGDYRSPGIRQLAILEDGVYKKSRRFEFNDLDAARLNTVASDTTVSALKYSIGGGIVQVYPIPTTSVTLGMRMIYSALVTYDSDDDDSTLQLPIELQPCVYLVAAAMLLSDVGIEGNESYKLAENVYKEWASGFKTTIGADIEQITSVAGVQKIGWTR